MDKGTETIYMYSNCTQYYVTRNGKFTTHDDIFKFCVISIMPDNK